MAPSGNAAPEIPGVDLVGVVGSGGSGVVYLGRQRAFDRDVAVKVIASGAPDDAVRRWEREVAAIGRLSNHPNILPVFDAGIAADGAPYLVMPFVPGGNLGDRLREHGPMRPDEVASVGAKLAGALSTVHAAGVLHRDLKPDNVLWSPHGEPQLTDFGIARLQDLTTTTTGDLHATVAYAAPEVLAGEPATEAADVYGLGATLHACLTGRPPYRTDGRNVAALVAQVLEQPPEPLPTTGASAAVADVIERAMRRDPAARHPSAAVMRGALEETPSSSPPSPTAPPTTVLPAADPTSPITPISGSGPSRPPERPPRGGEGPGGRNVTLWAMVLAVLGLFVGLVAYGFARDDGAGRTETTSDQPAADRPPSTEDPTTTEGPTTTEDPTTTEAPTSTEPTTTEPSTTTPGRAPTDGEAPEGIVDAATTYIRTLDRGRLHHAWQLTTPRFRNSQDRAQWERFWTDFEDISIVGDVRADARSGSAVVPLSFDGQREDYRLELRQQGGRWLVDGPVGNPVGGR